MIILIFSYAFAIVITTVAAVVIRYKLAPKLHSQADSSSPALNRRIRNIERGMAILLEVGTQKSTIAELQNVHDKRTTELISELSTPGMVVEESTD